MTFYAGQPRTAQVAIGNPDAVPFEATIVLILWNETDRVRLGIADGEVSDAQLASIDGSVLQKHVTVPAAGDTFSYELTPHRAGVYRASTYIGSGAWGTNYFKDVSTFTVEAGDNAPDAPKPDNGMLILAGLGAAALFVLGKRK